MGNDEWTRIPLLIKSVNQLISHSIKELFDETGLTTPQIMVLSTLGKNGSMKLSDISEKLNLSNSTISGIVDRLEKQDYVERIRSKEDRRVVYVSVCEKSKNIMHTAIHEKIQESLRKKLTKADQGQIDDIIKGLEILKELLKD
ncbi:MarR family transcriptional regulator [Clostridium bovifaecis]|uniref:MarR family transcriptional regulator n=1 Tax=Clostridium bovifaecis TaxID=2184719 RepID=A0A6I6F0R8_9CLOT|nr:MarR family transcriptional regulator [Clostridium bovifaecis]